MVVMKSANDFDNMQNGISDSERHVAVEEFESQSVDVDCGNDDIEFVWEREITSPVKATRNVLNIPRKAAEGCVTRSTGTKVNIIDVDNGNWYGSELHSAKRKKDEKFVGKGWYEFEKEKQLRKGDVLGFTFDPSEGFLYVEKKNN
ncbi:hypothetical protein KIW84_054992 [Lathyrus oleraceus]|uniref:TF-B3 domain-containing protein n=1 Tax=Pisum sativum TaxID=3888 RepID=A0A9D4WVR4_PEA|nr:hypothetical protein KIW84_054992 [Pisum sativum]